VASGTIAAGAANEVIMRLARILVPVNFTREVRFRHDPALPVPPLPALAWANEIGTFDDHRLGFAQTQLTRGQNRLVAALREARRLVEGARS
jgi:N-acetylated-alpha-linked acidic dipeptidase